MALAAVVTLAISAVGAPAPAHAQRGLGVGIAAGLLGGAIVGGAIASSPYYYGPGYGYGPGYYGPGYGYYGRPAYVAADTLWVLLAAPALLGRLRLAGPQRSRLRLIRSSSLKLQGVPENRPFSGTYACNGQKKTAFSDHEAGRLLMIDRCALL